MTALRVGGVSRWHSALVSCSGWAYIVPRLLFINLYLYLVLAKYAHRHVISHLFSQSSLPNLTLRFHRHVL